MPALSRDARAEIVRLGMLELRAMRGRMAKITTEDVARLLDLVAGPEAAALASEAAPASGEGAGLLSRSAVLAALSKYGRHVRGCSVLMPVDSSHCSCGLDAALDSLRPMEEHPE